MYVGEVLIALYSLWLGFKRCMFYRVLVVGVLSSPSLVFFTFMYLQNCRHNWSFFSILLSKFFNILCSLNDSLKTALELCLHYMQFDNTRGIYWCYIITDSPIFIFLLFCFIRKYVLHQQLN